MCMWDAVNRRGGRKSFALPSLGHDVDAASFWTQNPFNLHRTWKLRGRHLAQFVLISKLHRACITWSLADPALLGSPMKPALGNDADVAFNCQ